MPIVTDIDKVRLEIGDTEAASYLLSDEEVTYFLSQSGGNILGAAWRACDALARRFARAYDFETDGQKFKRSQQFEAFSKAAASLKARSADAGGTITTTRVDGYSDDLTNEDIDLTQNNPRRRFYGEEDRYPT